MKEASEEETSITIIANAEPIDSVVVDGAGALACLEDNLYSVPTVPETDNALTEYTFVKEVKVEKPKLEQLDQFEVYSSASTLSLGETVILSDGWLNRSTSSREQSVAAADVPSPTTNTTQTTSDEIQDSTEAESDFILTLDVDTSASVI